MNQETKNIVGLIVNLFIPGIGTIIWGDVKTGVIQLVLGVLAIPLCALLIGFVTIPGIWIWALVQGIQRLTKKS